MEEYPECPINGWFELTRAQFLTVPRSIMEAMPCDWREKMAALLRELDDTFDWRPAEGNHWVTYLRDGRGRYKFSQLCEYRHPDRAFIESLRVPRSTRFARAAKE